MIEKTIFIFYSSPMRTLLFVIFSSLVLASCTLGQKGVNPSVTPGTEIPPEAKTQSGYDYPAMPLDQYNQMNSGTSVPAV